MLSVMARCLHNKASLPLRGSVLWFYWCSIMYILLKYKIMIKIIHNHVFMIQNSNHDAYSIIYLVKNSISFLQFIILYPTFIPSNIILVLLYWLNTSAERERERSSQNWPSTDQSKLMIHYIQAIIADIAPHRSPNEKNDWSNDMDHFALP